MAEAEFHQDVARCITHAELVYRPGERPLAARVLGRHIELQWQVPE